MEEALDLSSDRLLNKIRFFNDSTLCPKKIVTFFYLFFEKGTIFFGQPVFSESVGCGLNTTASGPSSVERLQVCWPK